MFGRTAGARRKGTLLQGATHEIRHHDHAAIYQAIVQQDVAAAAHAMAEHVDRELIPACEA